MPHISSYKRKLMENLKSRKDENSSNEDVSKSKRSRTTTATKDSTAIKRSTNKDNSRKEQNQSTVSVLGKEKKEKDTSSDLYKIQDYERKMIELNMREEMIDLREQSLDEQFEEINSARLELEKTRQSTQTISTGADSSALSNELIKLQAELIKREKMIFDAKQNAKSIRAKYEATMKRESRLRSERISMRSNKTTERLQKKPISKTRFTKCPAEVRATRINNCVEAIQMAIGIDSENADFDKVLKRVISEVLEQFGMQTQLTVEDDVQFVTRFDIPDHARTAMKSFFRNRLSFDPFNTNASVRLNRKNEMKPEEWCFVEHPDDCGVSDGKKGRQLAYSYFIKNVQKTVDTVVKNLIHANKLIIGAQFKDNIVLTFMLDKGGNFTKCGISIANLVDSVGSPKNFILLGISTVSESYNNVKKCFGSLLTQIDALNGSAIEAGNIHSRYRLTIGGDYKALAMLMGHAGASSKYFCPACDITKTNLKTWKPNCRHSLRTGFVIGEKNIKFAPLLPSITAADIIPPVNHTLTGLVKKAMALLEKKLSKESEKWGEDEEEELDEITENLTAATNTLKSLREFKSQVVNVIHATRANVDSTSRRDSQSCCKICIVPYLSGLSSDLLDLLPCTKCDRVNHLICNRSWDSNHLTIDRSSNYLCLDCSKVDASQLLTKDESCLAALEVEESELVDLIMKHESEQGELLRKRSRTNEKLVEELSSMKLQCGVYPRFYYADLVGKDARRLTESVNARRLWSLVDNQQDRDFGIALFDTLHEIFSHLHAGFQDDAEKASFRHLLDRLQVLWSSVNPTETVTLKLHGLTHLADMMDNQGYAGRQVELVEHVHHVFNVLWPRYSSVTPLEKRLFIVVCRFASRGTQLLI